MRSAWKRAIWKSALLFVAVAFVSSSAVAQVVGTVRVVPTYLTSEADNGLKMDMSSFPVTVGLFSNRFALHATFPYVQMHAEVPVTYIGGPIFRIPVGGQVIDEDGPGDVVVSPSFAIVEGGLSRPWVWVGARVKVPTADSDKYLGTGKYDYGPDAGIMGVVNSRLLLLGSAFYDVRGDTQYVDYTNTLALTGAGRIRVGAVSGLTFAGTHGSGLVEDADPVWTVTTGYDHPFRNGYSIYGGAFKELSGPVNAYGVAIGFIYREGPLNWGG
ncbi:MAG TPA: hypothetical protein VFB49_00265 [Patescibacteria group bacterium]|nr:hypothetical protein [Patescibacteria group bacterium]